MTRDEQKNAIKEELAKMMERLFPDPVMREQIKSFYGPLTNKLLEDEDGDDVPPHGAHGATDR